MGISLLILLLSTLLFPVSVLSFIYPNLKTPDNPCIYTYRRFSEIEKQCSSFLPSPSNLNPDENRGNKIKTELAFYDGEWGQESGGALLMPYDDSDKQYSIPESFLKLVSFKVMDVDPVRRSENMVSVSAIMDIGITRDGSLFPSTDFHMVPGHSTLRILFEGVYIESEDNGGERLMCLLGTSMRPASSQVIDSQEPVNGCDCSSTYSHKLPLVQDDQIMLILRYPKTFALTTRGISGEMKSLNEKFDPNYFDGVRISSQLGHYSKYQFGSEELLKACSPYPYQDKLVDDEVSMFKGEHFCWNLQKFVWDGKDSGKIRLVPNWESVDTNDFGRLGPFVFGGETKPTADDHFDNFRLLIQDLQCEPGNEQNKIKTVKVSAVFRLIHSREDRSDPRTGLSGMTLSAEGIWTSSGGGQLCMVGCVGLVGATSNTCNSRICLYLPLTVSITERNIVSGTISSIDKTEAHITLLFEKVARPTRFILEYQMHINLKWSYKYSKVTQASAFHTRCKPSILGTKLRKLLLRYPSFHGSNNVILSRLSDVLSLSSRAVSYPFSDAQAHQSIVEIEVLSSGPLFGRYYWPDQNGENLNVEKQIHSNTNTIEISGHVTATGVSNISLFMEGIYDHVVGEMYLIGCKDVRAFQKIIKNGTKLERGMDCQIEIKIDYPPRNVRWLLTPKARISISSKRKEDDSLHFSPISLETFPITYIGQEDDIVFRKGNEEMLRILMLIMAILCIHCQLRYIKNQEETSAYISLVMLGVQVLSYSIPLITGNASLFKWKAFQSPNEFRKYEDVEELDFVISSILLYALIVTLRLCNEVRASRVSLTRTHPGGKNRFPSDILVLLITLAIYILGFLILHVVREMNAVQSVPQLDIHSTTSSTIQKPLKLQGELNDYSFLIQDFFLLPQIFSNMLWRIQVKPLSKSYYVGLTTIRVLFHAHAYDSIRHPVSHPVLFPYNEFENPSSDLNSIHGNIAIAVTMIVLAMILHIQQRCTPHQNVSQSQTLKPVDRLLFMMLKVYVFSIVVNVLAFLVFFVCGF